MPSLTLVFLAVSCLSFSFQMLSLVRLARQRVSGAGENLVSRGYARTVTCRVLAAIAYVAVAAVQAAGDGTLSAEALLVFGSVQALWIINSAMDIRIKRTLSRSGPRGRHAG